MKIGPFLKCPHPEMIEALAAVPFDFAVVDMEHTPLAPRDLYPLKLAGEAKKIPLIVRIPELTESYFKWCLDLGFEQIQIPFVQNASDAKRAIELAYYAPKGNRGLCRFVRAAGYSSTEVTQYLNEANQKTKIILQIEGEEGVKNIDSILAVPWVSHVFIGPYDLSQSLKMPGEIWQPAVLEKMNEVLKKCHSKKIQVGTFTDTPAGIAHWKKAGVDFVEYASDLNLLIGASRSLKDNVK